MPALSPPQMTSSSRISPRVKAPKLAPRANSNAFASLSPDLPENALPTIDQEIETSSNHKNGDVLFYPRDTLLLIAKQCMKRGFKAPTDLAPLETCKIAPQPKSSDVVDPAIASIGQPGNGGGARRAGGGFGEGFGFGGGIGGGGRGIGRGGRNIGLRRQNDPAGEGEKTIQQQMNRLVAKQNGGRQISGENQNRGNQGRHENMRNDNGRNEWRSKENYNHPPRTQYDQDEVEPSWMDDTTPISDPAISQIDPLIHFTPGEDMIAKHKASMKERDLGQRWRFDSAPAPPVDTKPKAFNNADYLKPNKVIEEVPAAVQEVAPQQQQPEPSSAFASRFQRFFAADNQHAGIPVSAPPKMQAALISSPQPAIQSPPPPPPPSKPDDHASRLMGLLSLGADRSSSRESAQHQISQYQSHQPMNHQMVSPPPFLSPPTHQPPPFQQPHQPHYDQAHTPQALLQQLYNPSLNNGPSSQHRPPQQFQQLPPHMMLPPQQPPLGYPSYPRPPMPPQFYGPGPPGYQSHMPPQHVLGPPQGPPGFHRPPGDRQQEILNTLFAGLGPGR